MASKSHELGVVEINGQSYRIERLQSEDWQWQISGPGPVDFYLTDEQLTAIHLIAAQIEACSDDGCSCWDAGYQRAQQSVGDWHKPPGY